MLNSFMSKLPDLMKDQNPDLRAAFGKEFKELGIELLNPVIIKNIAVNMNSNFTAGKGLQSMQGSIVINFKDKFNFKMKDPKTGDVNTFKIASTVTLTLCKDGLSKIEGIEVDIPGPIDPDVKSALIVGDFIEVKVGPTTQKIPLPKK